MNTMVNILQGKLFCRVNIPEKYKKVICSSFKCDNNIEGNIDICIKKNIDNYYELIQYRNGQVLCSELVKEKFVLFSLFVGIEDVFLDKFLYEHSKALPFHGGCTRFRDKSIMVIQNKGGGKTTLLALLSSNLDFKFMSDDLTLVLDKIAYSLPLPLRIRDITIDRIVQYGDIKGSCSDFNDVIRYIYMPRNVNEDIYVPISFILVPQYCKECENKIYEIKGQEKVMTLISHIKDNIPIRTLYKEICVLAKDISVYRLIYSDINWVINQLKSLYENYS